MLPPYACHHRRTWKCVQRLAHAAGWSFLRIAATSKRNLRNVDQENWLLLSWSTKVSVSGWRPVETQVATVSGHFSNRSRRDEVVMCLRDFFVGKILHLLGSYEVGDSASKPLITYGASRAPHCAHNHSKHVPSKLQKTCPCGRHRNQCPKLPSSKKKMTKKHAKETFHLNVHRVRWRGSGVSRSEGFHARE